MEFTTSEFATILVSLDKSIRHAKECIKSAKEYIANYSHDEEGVSVAEGNLGYYKQHLQELKDLKNKILGVS